MRYSEVKLTEGGFEGIGPFGRMSASWTLFLIREAWDTGCDELWEIQDGYGSAGLMPAQGHDWSGIRDSSPEAITKMVEVALNHLFGEKS